MVKCQHGSLWRFFGLFLPPKSEKVEGIFCIVSFLTAVTVACHRCKCHPLQVLVPWYKEAKRNKRSQCVPVADRANAAQRLFQAGSKMLVTGFHISMILHCPNAFPPRQCTATMFVLSGACQVKTTEKQF